MFVILTLVWVGAKLVFLKIIIHTARSLSSSSVFCEVVNGMVYYALHIVKS